MKQTSQIGEWLASSALNGANQSYIEELYENYLQDPHSVDESWQQIFDKLPKHTIVEQAHSPVRQYLKRLARDNNAEGAALLIPK
ncbi:Putative=2-oxoglutarate dehydrogenase E1 component [Avibacterium paragallinarum JF4211]|nr:Putative=2-oxoglutarate dehydrogenase E1 component [Avibacterium paragallinarum JF4211]